MSDLFDWTPTVQLRYVLRLTKHSVHEHVLQQRWCTNMPDRTLREQWRDVPTAGDNA